MLETIVIVIIVLALLGSVTGPAFGWWAGRGIVSALLGLVVIVLAVVLVAAALGALGGAAGSS